MASKRQGDLRAAIEELAALFPFGALQVDTTPADFLRSVAAEVRRARSGAAPETTPPDARWMEATKGGAILKALALLVTEANGEEEPDARDHWRRAAIRAREEYDRLHDAFGKARSGAVATTGDLAEIERLRAALRYVKGHMPGRATRMHAFIDSALAARASPGETPAEDYLDPSKTSDAEVDAALRSAGGDPDAIGRRGEALGAALLAVRKMGSPLPWRLAPVPDRPPEIRDGDGDLVLASADFPSTSDREAIVSALNFFAGAPGETRGTPAREARLRDLGYSDEHPSVIEQAKREAARDATPALRAGYAPKGGETVHALDPANPYHALCGCEASPVVGLVFEVAEPFSCLRCARKLAGAAPRPATDPALGKDGQ